MANTKISALTDGSPAVATDQIPVNRGGTNYRVNAGTIGAPGPGFFNALNYGAVADNNTDNATPFANLATAVNAYSETAVNTQLVGAAVVYFPAGTYLYTSGLAFTQPVTLLGEQGSILNYTGTAKAVEFGPSNLIAGTLQSGIYTVDSLTFTGGSGMTYGLYFNTFLVVTRIRHCNFRNFGKAGATIWAVYYAGNGTNWDNLVFGCSIVNDDNVARNFLKVASTNNNNSQLRFQSNFFVNLDGSHGTTGSTAANSGIGVWSNGAACNISGNNFNFFNPCIHLGSLSAFTKIINNYAEGTSDGTGKPIIEFDTTSNLIIDALYTNLHGGGYVLGPTDGSQVITNSLVQNVYSSGNNSGGELIKLNNTAGQTGNIYFNLQAQSAFIPTTTGGSITAWVSVQTA